MVFGGAPCYGAYYMESLQFQQNLDVHMPNPPTSCSQEVPKLRYMLSRENYDKVEHSRNNSLTLCFIYILT